MRAARSRRLARRGAPVRRHERRCAARRHRRDQRRAWCHRHPRQQRRCPAPACVRRLPASPVGRGDRDEPHCAVSGVASGRAGDDREAARQDHSRCIADRRARAAEHRALRSEQGRSTPVDARHGRRARAARHPGERHRPGLFRDRAQSRAARRPRVRCMGEAAHAGRPLGRSARDRRTRGVPRVTRSRLRHRPDDHDRRRHQRVAGGSVRPSLLWPRVGGVSEECQRSVRHRQRLASAAA